MLNWKKPSKLMIALTFFVMLISCNNTQTSVEAETSMPETEPTNAESTNEPPPLTETKPTNEPSPSPETKPTDEPSPLPETAFDPLPQRSGPRTQTSGKVPHVQIGVELVEDVNDKLHQLAFCLPDVENRPTIVSLPGARGIWISDEIPLAHPEVIVSGREFAHIHPDGSLHAPLPYARALEAVQQGWAERHPWADEREGWDGFVMLFTPQSMAGLDVTIQLIVESYNFTTGRAIKVTDLTCLP